jgi:hypothetical protein
MEEQKVDQAQTPEAPPETAAPDLNINDLVAIRNIIDVASQRGAFKANELESVGKTYNKLAGFLDAVTKQKESA